jgi:hypothetical protein
MAALAATTAANAADNATLERAIINQTIIANKYLQQQMAATAPPSMLASLQAARSKLAAAGNPGSTSNNNVTAATADLASYPATARLFLQQQAAKNAQTIAAATAAATSFTAPTTSFTAPADVPSPAATNQIQFAAGLPRGAITDNRAPLGTIDPQMLLSGSAGFASLPLTRPALVRRATGLTATTGVSSFLDAAALVRPELLRRGTTEGHALLSQARVTDDVFSRPAPAQQPTTSALGGSTFDQAANMTMKSYLESLLQARGNLR